MNNTRNWEKLQIYWTGPADCTRKSSRPTRPRLWVSALTGPGQNATQPSTAGACGQTSWTPRIKLITSGRLKALLRRLRDAAVPGRNGRSRDQVGVVGELVEVVSPQRVPGEALDHRPATDNAHAPRGDEALVGSKREGEPGGAFRFGAGVMCLGEGRG